MYKRHVSLRRRPFLTPVWLAAFGFLLLLGAAAWLVSNATTTTVVVLRHAEKGEVPADDPVLSAEGEARARRLAALLAAPGQRFDAVFVSQYRRSQETARPLADQLGVPVITVPGGEPSQVVERALGDYRGGRIIVIGHSNTVPEIVRQLGGRDIPDMADSDYGTVYVVARPRFGRTTVLRLATP